MRRVWVMFVLLGAAQSQSSEPVIRIDVNLVQMDAVVTDTKGRQVTDLKAEDFEVLQDGKAQRVAAVTYVKAGVRAKDPVKVGRGSVKIDPRRVRRTIAFVIDDLGVSFEGTAHARDALRRWIATEMTEGDLVAVIRTGAGMGALQSFTSDPRMLNMAVDRIKPNYMARTAVFALNSVERGNSLTEEQRVNEMRNQMLLRGSMGAVSYVLRGLKEMPGRKTVVLVSERMYVQFRDESPTVVMDMMRQVGDEAGRAAVVINTIDPRSLDAMTLKAEDDVGNLNQWEVVQELNDRRRDNVRGSAGMAYLAALTGGRFVRNSNNLAVDLQKIMADQDGYYLISYVPAAGTFDRRYHSLKVRVKRDGLVVRTRGGFEGVEDKAPQQVTTPSKEEQMKQALLSPFASGDIRLNLTATYVSSPKGPVVQSLLNVNGNDLHFEKAQDGLNRAQIEVLQVTFGDNGRAVNQSTQAFELRLKDDAVENAKRRGVTYRLYHPVKQPGGYQLRTALRDAVTGKIGSVSQFVEVPDETKGKLLLSGLLVYDRPPAENADNLANREFHPGQDVYYAMQVLNAPPGAMAMGRKLYRDGKLVEEKAPKPMDVAASANRKRFAVMNGFRLGAQQPAGDYVLEVNVNGAMQWIDFQVVQ